MSDDLVVHGSTQKQHDSRLETVLKQLSEYGLTLKKEKCVMGSREIEFLGHHLSTAGVDPGKGIVEGILGACQPKDALEVHSFMRLVNYKGRFIPNLPQIANPLRRLTKKN